jgi:hypothetical protein
VAHHHRDPADDSPPPRPRPSAAAHHAPTRAEGSDAHPTHGQPRRYAATTRHLIRTFVVWTNNNKINTTVKLDHRQAKSTRSLTQDQRLAWLKELLSGDAESFPYRVAGTLLLLYAQPLVKVAAPPTTAVVLTPHEMRISLGVTTST